ncbi:MAG: hypothetical protein AB1752_11385 [Candidatus Zixiibacteriota bacterium]
MPSAIVSIDTIPAIAGRNVKVPVRLSYDSASPVSINDLGVIDLLLTYDDSLLFFIKAERGDAIDEWEYFTYRTSLFGQQESDREHVQVVIRRNMANGIDPDPPQLKPAGVLVWLTFFVSADWYETGTSAGVDFLLRDCESNVLQSDDLESYLYLPDLAHGSAVVEDGYRSDNCESWAAGQADDVVRGVTLQSGAITLVEELPLVRGDLDLDGVGFGASDLALYRSYFLHGFDVWNPAALTRQIAQSDVNRDGEPLTLADYEFMRNWMNDGEEIDSIPIHPYSTKMTLGADSSTAGELRLTPVFTAPVSVIWLLLEGMQPGAPSPVWHGPGTVEIEHAQAGSEMRVLVRFIDHGEQQIPFPQIRAHSGGASSPRLIAYQASRYPGEPVTPQVSAIYGP